jgi:hypothetical protein
MKILATILAIAFSAGVSWAQTCKSIATQFLKGIQEEKPKEAMDQAWATNPYSPGMKDNLNQLNLQLVSTLGTVGKYRGYELVTKKEWAARYAYLYYFVSFDRQPLKFEFHCYKATDKWVLQNFNFSDKVTADFAASASGELFKDNE